MSATDALGLRDRRRLQTEQEICDVALTLFERDGVEGTRVEDIARGAGVSPRTFFRYFPTKERAAFWREPELDDLVERMFGELTADAPLLPQVEAVYVAAMATYENGASPSGRRLLRLWRLVGAQPSLRLAVLGVEEERNRDLAERLRGLLGADEADLRPRLIVELSATAGRVAFEQWAEARDRGEDVDLLDVYARSRTLMRALPQDV